MINLKDQSTQYALCVMQDSQVLYIEETAQSVTWGGAVGTAARSLTATCVPHEQTESVAVGNTLVLLREDTGTEIIRGIITEKGRRTSGNQRTTTYSVNDARWWLLRSKHDEIYRKMSATDIVAACCSKFGVPVGELVDTGVIFPELQIINKTVWDTIIVALTETRKVTGKRYTTKIVNGKLCLKEKLQYTHQWVIEEAQNLLDSTYTESIAETYTQILVVGKNDDKSGLTAVVRDDAMVQKYGVLQERIEQTEAKSQSELNAIAAQKLKELAVLKKSGTITAIGLDDVEAGDGIYVIDSTTGMIGSFWVASDQHSLSNGHHSMTLELSWTDELPEIEYEAPKSTETKSKSK